MLIFFNFFCTVYGSENRLKINITLYGENVYYLSYRYFEVVPLFLVVLVNKSTPILSVIIA